MALNELTITITDSRIIDGYVQAAINNGMSPEGIVLDFVNKQGGDYANLFKIGVITTAAFIARLTPQEYTAIITAAAETPEIAQLVQSLIAETTIYLNDTRVVDGVNFLVSEGFFTPERAKEILHYDRPEYPMGKD